MMRRAAFTMALLTLGALPSLAQEWTPLPPLPQARYGSAGAALGESFFVLGGNSGADLASTTAWSAATGWSSLSPMSMTRQFPGAAVVGGFVYAIGGLSNVGMAETTVERFDPAANTWSPAASLPGARALMGVATWNGDIFVLGGESVFGELLGETFRYSASGNSWSTVAPIPMPCSGPGAAAMGNEIYVVGGSNMSLLNLVQVYDPQSDSWRAGPALPEPLWMPAVASFEGRIWVMGGFDQFFGRSDRVYSLGSDGAWQTEAPLPQGLASSAVGSSGSQLVIAGGMNASGQPVNVALTRMGEVEPPPPPPPAEEDLVVQAEFSPKTLNVSSRGNWVSVKLWAFEWNVADIDVASLLVGGVAADPSVAPKFGQFEGATCMTLKLPRSEFAGLSDGEHVLQISGATHAGAGVSGEVSLRVVGADKPKNVARGQGPSLKPMPGGRAGQPGHAMELHLDDPAAVRLDVVDIQGRVVDRVTNQTFAAGDHRIEMPGARRLQPGIYFVRARVGAATLTSRIAVLK